MKININVLDNKQDCDVYYLYENGGINNLQSEIKISIELYIKKEKFKGEWGEIFTFTKENGEDLKDVILIGLGKEEELDKERIRSIYGKTVKKIKELKCKNANLHMIKSIKISFGDALFSGIEGLYLSDYKYTKYKTDKKESSEIKVNIIGLTEEEAKAADKIYEEAKVLSEATIAARNLVNEPPNVLTPKQLSKEAKALGEKYGFEVQVFNREEIEELNMEAFLSVAKGSENPPRLIVMRYVGDKSNKDNILGLVGKGLTYDSGGYSIKPTESMATMKNDMGGSAAVIGAMCAISSMKLKVNVTAVVASCENMISGAAYKPGDIIGSMAGKKIEVLNTDAEGRLTLADAVHYIIEKEKVSRVIDVATLTGAALVALGVVTTAVITNNVEFYSELQKASDMSGEKVWQLPSSDEYKKLIKSDIADLKNTGGRWAGTITAGLFIGEFVQKKPWIHLDIAGTAWSDNDKEYIAKGGTGVGVRTLYYMAKNIEVLQ